VLGETCFSGAALTLLGIILTPVLTAFGILYRDALKSRDARIAWLEQEMVDRLRHGAQVMDEAETELRTRSPGRRR
jgi:hypothetical protein